MNQCWNWRRRRRRRRFLSSIINDFLKK